MRTKKITYIFLFFILLGTFLLFEYFYQKNQPQSDSVNNMAISDDDFKTYIFKNDQIEKAIVKYLLSEDHFSWDTRNDSHNFCVIENLKPENELFPLYIWAYCGEYIIQAGRLQTLSGFSGPAKINYPNELSFYNLSNFSYETPKDGNNYSEDVKKIFPEATTEKIFTYDAKYLKEKIENLAFTGISSWNYLKQAIADCEIESVMQNHNLQVTAIFKNGQTLTAQEPEIDDIFDLIKQYDDKCGNIIMATE